MVCSFYKKRLRCAQWSVICEFSEFAVCKTLGLHCFVVTKPVISPNYPATMSDPKQFNYRQFLKHELRRRQRRNAAYSIRAFSRDLGMASSRLSEILVGKKGISVDRAVFISSRLQLEDAERSFFVDLVQYEHSRSEIARQFAQERIAARLQSFRKLETTEEYVLLSDWYHLAILELLAIEENHTVEAFAARLGLQAELVAESIDKLMKANYLKREKNKWVPKEPDRQTNEDIPSEAIRNYHKKMLEKTKSVLDLRSVDERDISSVVFAMDSEDVSYVKERIREFRINLSYELNQKSKKNGVYCLALQFFELTEKK